MPALVTKGSLDMDNRRAITDRFSGPKIWMVRSGILGQFSLANEQLYGKPKGILIQERDVEDVRDIRMIRLLTLGAWATR